MSYKSDIEIAQATPMQHIRDIAKEAGIDEKYLEQYGNYKAKIDYSYLEDNKDKPDGKLVLVTAINPTPALQPKIFRKCFKKTRRKHHVIQIRY